MSTTIEEPALYTSEDLANGISSLINTISKKMDFIPQDLQLPFVIALGLLGFLTVLGLSKLSARSAEVQVDGAPSTPKNKSSMTTRSNSGTPLAQKTGTVMTPAGRRSARIARTRRKEE